MLEFEKKQEDKQLQKQKQISENAELNKRDTAFKQAGYLPESLLNKTNLINDEEVEYQSQKYYERYVDISAESFRAKADKYNDAMGNVRSLEDFSKKYKNRSSSKRKGKLDAAKKHYEKAARMSTNLMNRGLEANSKAYKDGEIAILNERLEGMTEAAKAKSYSDNDEKLRICAAKVRIYLAMLKVYGKDTAYEKKKASLQRQYQKELAKYNQLLKKDQEERQAEAEKERREQAKKQAKAKKQNQKEKKEKDQEQQLDKIKKKEEKKSDQKKDKKVKEVYDLTEAELRDVIQKIVQGEPLGDIPFPKNYSFQLNINGEFTKLIIDKDMYEEARRQVDLNREINSDPEEMENALEQNAEQNYAIVQGVLAYYKKRLFAQANIKAAQALGKYVGETRCCNSINKFLRTGKDSLGAILGAADLKKALQGSNAVIDHDIVVRRGVELHSIAFMLGKDPKNMSEEDLMELAESNKDNYCTDKGVISTSVMKTTGYDKDLELVILCKKGTHGLDISHNNGTLSTNEEELCLAPDTKFRIIETKKQEKGPFKIYLETVADNKDDLGELNK